VNPLQVGSLTKEDGMDGEKDLQDVVEAQPPVVVSDRPAYERPRVTVMDEAEVLKAFQFTSAAITWWVM
jgi:hypothetical protein